MEAVPGGIRGQGKKLTALARAQVKESFREANQTKQPQQPQDPFRAKLAGLGLLGGIQSEDEFFLWPENVSAWLHWNEVQQHWRSDGGLSAQDLRAYLDECGLVGEERADVWNGVRACAVGVLQALEDERKRPRAPVGG